MRWWVCLALLMAAPAFAEPTTMDRQHAKELYEQGKLHYRGGDLDKAADEFKQAYDLTGEASLLYNLAQTHRLAQHSEKALFFYGQYLSVSSDKISPTQRSVIERHISELRRIVEEEQRSKRAAPEGPDHVAEAPARTEGATPAATPVPTPGPVAVAPLPQPWYRSVTGWILVSTGLVAVAVGAALFAHGQALDDDIARASSLIEARQLAADRDVYRGTGVGLLAGGGAATIAGIVVFTLVDRKHRTAHAYVAPSTNGVLVGGAF